MLGIDAGRVASMHYPSGLYQDQGHHQNPPLRMAANGFASRSKADSMRRISIPSLPIIATSSYDEDNSVPPLATPRGVARAQLLAGLRTAPKTPPVTAEQDDLGLVFNPDARSSKYPTGSVTAMHPKSNYTLGFIQNTRPTNATMFRDQAALNNAKQSHVTSYDTIGYSYGPLPTPPASSVYNQGEQDIESKLYSDLLARNISLAQQQQVLQHQMRMVQQAQLSHVQQQLGQLQIQSPLTTTFATPPISPSMSSPVSTASFANQSAYSTLNSLTAPIGYYSAQTQAYSTIPSFQSFSDHPMPNAGIIHPLSSTRSSESVALESRTRGSSPPAVQEQIDEKTSDGKTPSPPPGGITTRRGHKKCSSLSSCINSNNVMVDCGPKTSVPKFSNTPSTPINSTFGGRGDHPIRQPRGPPGLEEILAKPTSKHEGGKNFASRQRKRAFTRLLNAGMERRSGSKPIIGSNIMPPVSEHDGALDLDGSLTGVVVSHAGPRFEDSDVAIESEKINKPNTTSRRGGLGVPQQALSSAEKRRSALF